MIIPIHPYVTSTLEYTNIPACTKRMIIPIHPYVTSTSEYTNIPACTERTIIPTDGQNYKTYYRRGHNYLVALLLSPQAALPKFPVVVIFKQ